MDVKHCNIGFLKDAKCLVYVCVAALTKAVICRCAITHLSSDRLIVSKGDLFSYLHKQCHSLFLRACSRGTALRFRCERMISTFH